VKAWSISPGEALGAQRGEVVVCIPVFGGHEQFVQCLEAVLAHTPPDVRILVCDDAGPDPRSAEFVSELAASAQAPHRLGYLRRERNLGFPANVNGAFAAAAPADVVVLNSDCTVAEGWLDGLRDAAYADARVATATALTNNGSIVSVPQRNRPVRELPPGWTLDRAAAAVRAAALRIRPRLPTAIGHCVYIRRSALELVGEFDAAFAPGYGEEVDFSQRCTAAGLCHVLADDVFVLHAGGASLAPDGRPNPVQAEHEQVLADRYPYYHDAVEDAEEDHSGPLARALGVARRALTGASVVIDARILTGPMTGTQLQVLEVIAALARTEQLRITVIMPERPGDYAERTLESLPGVRLVDPETVQRRGFERADLVHRPFQVGSDEDIAFLAPLGERLIVTNQDLISYYNPSYFPSSIGWRGYREITRSALAIADHVVFISEHARDEALAEDLLDPGRASVVYNGTDRTLLGARAQRPVAPPGAERLPADADAILCLGTDFRHKNRVFALRLLAELRERHGWPGYLVLAGPHVRHGSSLADEADWLGLNPAVARAVIELPTVSEEGKAWLYERAALVLYPTVHEGFGLVPFEAAEHDRPCLWAPVTALAEVLPVEAAAVVPWSPELTAEAALRLLRDASAREQNVHAIRDAGRGLSWERTAGELLRIYRETCDAPVTPASAMERRYGFMRGTLSQDALRLIGPHGVLPADLQRPLLALAMHPQLGRPMFRVIKLGYRASYAWRRRRGRVPEQQRVR
jgi:GT2 family glycosyltransferase/glycosyltransferase involved in cell wall biosynthesis